MKIWVYRQKKLSLQAKRKKNRYGTDSKQKPEIISLHQGGGGHNRREREPAALLGEGVSALAPENGEFDGREAIHGEGHRAGETHLQLGEGSRIQVVGGAEVPQRESRGRGPLQRGAGNVDVAARPVEGFEKAPRWGNSIGVQELQEVQEFRQYTLFFWGKSVEKTGG